MNGFSSGSERGAALPLALLILVGLGFVATGAAFMSSTDSRISASYSASNSAMAAAEAALEHGVMVLDTLSRAGQDPDDQTIVQSSLGRFSYTVTVTSKREQGQDLNGDGDQSDVVLYAQSFGYSDAKATGAPGDTAYPVKLLVAVATDIHRGTNARVQAEVAKEGWSANLRAPLVLSSPTNVILSGSFDVDGKLYGRDGTLVPAGGLAPAYGLSVESKAAAKSSCKYWKAGIQLPSEGVLAVVGSIESRGHVAFDHAILLPQNYDAEDPISSFKFTPEEVLAGFSADELQAAQKAASDVPDWMNLEGVNYVTSGNVPNHISGKGILIVHNPNYDVKKYDCLTFPLSCDPTYRLNPANQPMTLQINANGSFKGVIIADTLIRLGGTFNVLGSVVVLTTESINLPATGAGYLRWSCEAVRDALNEASSYSVRLSWEQYL